MEARLGGGGMGTVWRARDLLLDRAVAVKEVRPPDPALAEYDPDAARALRARVLREARALARVVHPNVVTIHHVVDGGDGTYPWLVMELVTGGSLADRLARGPMEPPEAAGLGRELLAALGAAHEAGIQHRDVKPANVLLRPDGRPVLTDFGIAAIRESTVLTATGSIIGTPDYMAPERITGERGGAASDLWSLAMMLYVAVEGRHPLRRATTLATLAAVLNEPVPPPERAGPLTAALTAVLVKDPDARPGRAALDGMLAAAARGESTAAGTDPVVTVPYAETAPVASDPGGPGGPGGPGDATSYPLPAPTPAPDQAVARGASADPGGLPEPISRDTAPVDGSGAPPGTATTSGEPAVPAPPPPPKSRLRARLTIGAALLSTAVTAFVVWTVLPRDGDTDRDRNPANTPGAAAAGATAPGKSPGKSSSASPGTSPGPGSVADDEPRNYLAPANLRRAIKALTAETGHDRVLGVTAYPMYVFFYVPVEGSDTRYVSYTFDERGLKPGNMRGSMMTGQRPVKLSSFDWDAVPALFGTAEKELRMKDVDSRYLLVKPPNTLFGDPPGMAAYLMTEFKETGYVLADTRGRIVSEHPPRL
ncbi:protein kinase [Streptomyces sp. NPDC058953]|uniref:serine/threonine-protein kinase n=1 Tax=Streptomyces sp. NPDC058953 TaxID=3346676 RepID=UPI00369DADFD